MAGHLEELQKGIGHRPSKYQVVPSRNSLSSHNKPLPLPLGRGNKREQVFGSAPKRIGEDEESLPVPQSRRQNREGPMKKFKQRWDQVKVWGPMDIVCYYRWLYYTRYGIMPELDWSICIGTARNLLKRLKDPKAVKRYLQIAFTIMRFKPQGLNSVYHSTLYEQVLQHWEDGEDFYDDYSDDWVFPWCKLKMRAASHKINLEYQRHLVQVGLSPQNRERRRLQRKERLDRVAIQSMKDNWSQYSEVRR